MDNEFQFSQTDGDQRRVSRVELIEMPDGRLSVIIERRTYVADARTKFDLLAFSIPADQRREFARCIAGGK